MQHISHPCQRGDTAEGGGWIPFPRILPNSTKHAIIHPSAASDGRRGPSFGRRLNFFLFPPPLHRRGVMYMVTYSDLFQFGILIVQIVALVIQVNNKKK